MNLPKTITDLIIGKAKEKGEFRKMVTEPINLISNEDLGLIKKWLLNNDPSCLLFAQTIYYTCMMPNEIVEITLGQVNLQDRIIYLASKQLGDPRPYHIYIQKELKEELEKVHVENFSMDGFLFGSYGCISELMLTEEKIHERFTRCLELNGISNKGYILYSFGHLSNFRKLKAGWTELQVVMSNRFGTKREMDKYICSLQKLICATK